MPRDVAGVYTLPDPPRVPNTPIDAPDENITRDDMAVELTNSLDRNGRGGMLAPFNIADGNVNAPGLAFLNDPNCGIYRIGVDDWAVSAGGVKVMEFMPNIVTFPVATTVNLLGPVAVGSLVVAGNVTINGNLTLPNGSIDTHASSAAAVAAQFTSFDASPVMHTIVVFARPAGAVAGAIRYNGSSGNMQIGTTSANNFDLIFGGAIKAVVAADGLHFPTTVFADNTAANLRLLGGGTAATDGLIIADAIGRVVIGHANAQVIFISPANRVMIGTALDDGVNLFQVAGGAAVAGGFSVAGSASIVGNMSANGFVAAYSALAEFTAIVKSQRVLGLGSVSLEYQGAIGLEIGTIVAGAPVVFYTGNTERGRFNATGLQVGNAALTPSDNSFTGNAAAGGGVLVRYRRGGATNFFFGHESAVWGGANNSASPMLFSVADPIKFSVAGVSATDNELVINNGSIQIASLAGAGVRHVVAAADGTLSAP